MIKHFFKSTQKCNISIFIRIFLSFIFINTFFVESYIYPQANQEILIYNIPKIIKDANVYSDKTELDTSVSFATFETGIEKVFLRLDLKQIKDLSGWEVKWFKPDQIEINSNIKIYSDKNDPHILSSVTIDDQKMEGVKGVWRIEFLKDKEKIYQTYFAIGAYPEILKRMFKKSRKLENEITDFNNISGEPMLFKNKFYSSLPQIMKNPWEDPLEDVDSIKIQKTGNKNGKTIAVLVFYNEYLNANKKSIKIKTPPAKTGIPDSYGYVYRYDIAKQQLQSNFMNEMKDYFEVEKFSNDKTTKQGGNRFFHRDLSYLISKKVTKYFLDRKFQVLNLTPARFSLKKYSINDIFAAINKKTNFDYLLLIPYRAYTKKVRTYTKKRTRPRKDIVFRGIKIPTLPEVGYDIKVGLILDCDAQIYELNKKKPLFKKSYSLTAIDSSFFSTEAMRIRFHSYSRDKNKNVDVLKDGIIDDEWTVNKTINGFMYPPRPGVGIGNRSYKAFTQDIDALINAGTL